MQELFRHTLSIKPLLERSFSKDQLQVSSHRQAWTDVLKVALEAQTLLTAPGKASPSVNGSQEMKEKIQGCVASLVALDTIWEVGKATYLPELGGYARTDLSSLEQVTVAIASMQRKLYGYQGM